MRDNAVSVLSAVVANWIITSSLCCDSSFEFLGHRATKSHFMLHHRAEIVTKQIEDALQRSETTWQSQKRHVLLGKLDIHGTSVCVEFTVVDAHIQNSAVLLVQARSTM
jgi:hypothetical protein